MRERLDDHSRLLELQLSGLEALVKEKGELDITVPAQAESEAELQDMSTSPRLEPASVPVRRPTNAMQSSSKP